MNFNIDDAVKLWINIFGDNESYIRSFYASFDTTGNVFTEYDGDVLCGMVNRVPIKYGQHNGGYIYAACTHPNYRGRGIFRKLLTKAEFNMPFVMLIPAEPKLYDMYRKLGYDKTAYSVFPCEVTDTYNFKRAFDGDYEKLYSLYLENVGDNEFIKPYKIFILSLSEYIKRGMLYYNEETDGFMIYETKSKDIIKIYDIYCKKNMLCDTIDEHESGVYKIIDKSVFMPQKMKVNLFMEG